jgi:RNA polymerase sigma-70 factor (ECF subfamily)
MQMIAGVPMKNEKTFPREFEALFRRCGQLVYRAAYNVTGNREDAQDVLQTVFLKLIQRRATNDIIRNPEAYLHRAAVHEALSVVRSRESRRLTGDDVESVEMPAPASESGRDEDIRRVREAMAYMKPEFLEVLNLHYIEGYTCVEIAERHDKFLGTVLADLFRARAELKKLIRIEEKRRETHTNHERDRRPVLAHTS